MKSSQSQNKSLTAHYLGVLDYSKSLQLQENLVEVVKADSKKQFILGLEHLPVVTLGVRSHKMSLAELGIDQIDFPLFKIRRGGLATLHMPGQLVIYPICDLHELKMTVKDFIQSLFVATQKTLTFFGVESSYDVCDKPGVFTSMGKIAFCGLQIKNGITCHGLSINIQNDLAPFSKIQACGVQYPQVDAVKNYNLMVTPEEFYKVWLENLDFATFSNCKL